jgi:hypothetical protein
MFHKVCPQNQVRKCTTSKGTSDTEDQAYKDWLILALLFPFLSAIPFDDQLSIMSTYKHGAGDLDDLLNQLCQATPRSELPERTMILSESSP